jgi:myo-inositol 2-dehydrogenase/D-chiro-inositol 1-dehydrogenase
MAPAPLPRRAFLGHSCAAAGSLVAATTAAVPAGGFFAGGGDGLRIGLIGCGGRGTGAAMQAAAAEPGVRITVLADLFADQIDSAAAVLGRAAGAAFDCPEARRFVGADAWRRAIEAPLDAVILATSPDARPTQVAAAVAAGRHVFCEAPAAIDAAGVAAVRAACALAEERGLAFGSGLAWRHDPATIHAIGRLRAGACGRLVAGVATSQLGPAWRRWAKCGAPLPASDARNWIACPARSGGDFVEHQVHAIDKLLWAFGDVAPAGAEPLAAGGTGGTAVRFVFADGRTIEAGICRQAGGRDAIAERVRGTAGSCDLRSAGAGRHGRGMAAFVRSIREGRPLAEGSALCRSTLTAVLGREAATAGVARAWTDIAPPPESA